MGCDGGTIPRRDELVKTKKKPEAKDKNSERLYRWQHCAISQTRLRSPIVVCELGRLYNKDEIITRLLDRSGSEAIPHIRGLKDVKELRLTPNPSYMNCNANKGGESVDDHTAEYICPITSVEMNGNSKFNVIWTCGCVISERAMKQIKSETCHKCNTAYSNEDVITLNPTEEQLPNIKYMMVTRREKAKAAKRQKKEGKRSADESQPSSSGEPIKKKNKSYGKCNKSSLLVRGMASGILQDAEFEKIRSSNYSVASDPKVSEVYKSLFDTHKTAHKKQTAHWVTCNPQYF